MHDGVEVVRSSMIFHFYCHDTSVIVIVCWSGGTGRIGASKQKSSFFMSASNHCYSRKLHNSESTDLILTANDISTLAATTHTHLQKKNHRSLPLSMLTFSKHSQTEPHWAQLSQTSRFLLRSITFLTCQPYCAPMIKSTIRIGNEPPLRKTGFI